MSADLRIDDYIKHIEDYATEAMVFIEGISKEEFLKDRKTQQAVTLNLITLGEISTVLKNKYPNFLEIASDIPWKDIAGMRHRLVHGYSEVDVIVVWDTVQEFVPKLIEAMPYVYKAVNEFKDKNINRDDAEPELGISRLCTITIKIRGLNFTMSDAACFNYTVKKQINPIILRQSLSDSIHRDVDDLLMDIFRQGGFLISSSKSRH